MKTIGLIGGMSWESTALYYRLLNEEVKKRLGGLHSAKVLLNSLDFQEIAFYQKQNEWQKAGEVLNAAALKLQSSGADVIALCTNTMHKVAKETCQGLSVPFLHIAEPTVTALKKRNYSKVGLLGTQFTMEQDFYKSVLRQNGLQVFVPYEADQNEVHRIIFEELCLGITKEDSRQSLLSIIEKMKAHGAEAIILGCTELVMLVNPEQNPDFLFDTTEIHAKALVDFATGARHLSATS